MASLEQFLPDVLLEVPQCPEPVALASIRNAAIDLCERALVWREKSDVQLTERGRKDYDIDLPNGARVATVIDVRVDDRPIHPTTLERIDTMDYGSERLSRPDCYYQLESDILLLHRTPDDEYPLDMTVAFAPKRNGNVLPDYIFEEHYETIRYGALHRLLSQMSKPWSDDASSMRYGQFFKYRLTEARVDATKSRVRSDLTVTPKPFA